jgi:RNA polymerase sigma-70 factor (ECF subfamily)
MADVEPDSVETQGLLAKAQAGDRAAFEQLCARFRPQLVQFIQRRMDAKMRVRLDPSDVVQETQLEVLRRLADFLERRPMPFRLWLQKTAYERLLMARRRHVETGRRAVGREVPLPERSSLLLARKLLGAGSTPSERLNRRELVRRVHQAVAQLPEADREVLFMRHFEGLSYQEVGYILGIDPAAARQRQGRALLRLHKLLSDGGLTESQL